MEKQYYIASGKDHLGPFSLSELKEKELNPDTLIWYEGLEQWSRIGEIEDLKPEIPVMPYVPPTPLQMRGTEQILRRRINIKLLEKSAKKAGVFFIILFVVRFVSQFILFSSSNIIERLNDMGIYTIDKNEAVETILFSSVAFSFLLSVILLVIFYIAEKQNPYNEVLITYNEEEKPVYNMIVKDQSAKYRYDEPLKIGSLYYGYGVLFYNTALIFFFTGFWGIVFTIIMTRLVSLLLVIEIQQEKRKKYGFLWGLSSLIFPALTLILLSSLYPKVCDSPKEDSYSEKSELEPENKEFNWNDHVN